MKAGARVQALNKFKAFDPVLFWHINIQENKVGNIVTVLKKIHNLLSIIHHNEFATGVDAFESFAEKFAVVLIVICQENS